MSSDANVAMLSALTDLSVPSRLQRHRALDGVEHAARGDACGQPAIVRAAHRVRHRFARARARRPTAASDIVSCTPSCCPSCLDSRRALAVGVAADASQSGSELLDERPGRVERRGNET